MRYVVLAIMLTTFLCSTMSAKSVAENDSARAITSSYYLKIGGSQLKDTYLSIIPYQGAEYGLGYERARVSRFGERKWTTRHLVEAEVAQTYNQRNNCSMMNYMLNYEFDFYRRYSLPCGLKLFVGGNLLTDIGATYTGSGNNPSAAKASLNLGFAAAAAYKFKIRNYPITIKNNLSLPSAGLFFCPQYGASYYEMFYLGNREDWIHFGWWGNNLYISNMLTIDLPVKRRAIRLGYQCKFRSMEQNHLVYKNYTHEFILGITVQKMIVNAR